MGFLDRRAVEDKPSEKWQEIVLFGFIFLGVAIALFAFFNNRSLWLDEAKIANNIVDRGFRKLLKPLSRNQVAPIGFLYVERFMAIIFGKTDWSLRIFPLASFLLSIPLFFSINNRLFESKIFVLFSCAIFSLTVSLLIYSSEVKQYSSDVFIALSVTWLGIYFLQQKSKKSYILYTLGGMLAVWFSNIAVVMLFTIGLYVMYTSYRSNPKKLIAVSIPIVFWMASFFTYYVLFIQGHRSQDMMINYWRGSFLPQNIFSSEFYLFLFIKTKMIFGSMLGHGDLWILSLVLYVLGIVINVNLGTRKILFLTLFPVFIHLALSSFQMYPFDKRLILYLAPFIIILFGQGIWFIYQRVNSKLAILCLLIPMGVNMNSVIRGVPFEHEEIKHSMIFLNENIGKDPTLYVSFGSKAAFQFYRDEYPNLKNIQSIIYGKSSRRDWTGFDNQLTELPNGAWLLFSHVYSNVYENFTDEQYVLRKLKENGNKVFTRQKFKRSAVHELSQ